MGFCGFCRPLSPVPLLTLTNLKFLYGFIKKDDKTKILVKKAIFGKILVLLRMFDRDKSNESSTI